MGPIGCPETSVTNYQSTVRNIPEDRRPQITIFVASSIFFFGTSETPQKDPGDRDEGFEPVTTRFEREDGADRLSRNVGNKLPINGA